MAISQQAKNKPLITLSTFKILIEAFKLPAKNTKQILPIITLSLLFTSSIYVVNYYLVTPLLTSITTNYLSITALDPTIPWYPSLRAATVKDLKLLIAIELFIFFDAFIISNLLSFATIHALSSPYSDSGEQTTLRELCSRAIKGPFITALYVYFLNLGYLLVVLELAGVCFFATHHGSMLWVAVLAAVALIALQVLYLCLTIAWLVAIVTSVVEAGCYGLEAIMKALRTVQGSKAQSLALALVQLVMGGIIFGVYSVTKHYLVDLQTSSLMAVVGAGVVYEGVGAVINLYGWAVAVVFYFDCKGRRIDGGEGGLTINGGFMYSTVPIKLADEEFP